MMRNFVFVLLFILMLNVHIPDISHAQSIDLPVKGYGLSFGNSKNFTGIRLNFRDYRVEEINGINITLWPAKDNGQAIVRGLSLGLGPEAGDFLGVQIGVAASATDRLRGISFGLLAAGAGNRASGLIAGGLAAGAGESMTGITLGGLGVGAGRDLTGIAIAGLGTGAGRNLTGLAIAGLAAGAGENMKGIAIAGLAAGAGGSASGIIIGGLAAGAGENLTGFALGALAAGSGNRLRGVAVGGVEASAPEIYGGTIAGFRTRSQRVKGVTLALGWVKVEESFTGLSVSAFNQIKGKQTGVALGVVNYAHQLNGIQIGLINYVRDNPGYRKILPVINANF